MKALLFLGDVAEGPYNALAHLPLAYFYGWLTGLNLRTYPYASRKVIECKVPILKSKFPNGCD